MDPNARLLLVGARYAHRDDAAQDFDRLWAARHQGKYDHVSVAVLTKDAAGELTVERHDSTTKHAAWGGAVLGAALVVVAPPAGLVAIAAGGAAMAGVGGVVGHLWHAIPQDDIRAVSRLLHSGETGLLAVLANWHPDEVPPLLARAEQLEVLQTTVGALDETFDRAIGGAEQRARDRAGEPTPA
jgi:uncharacterized membrane protein